MHKKLARRELDEGVKMLMTTNNNGIMSTSMQDLNLNTAEKKGSAKLCENNVPYRHNHNRHPHNHINEYRKSMPNLQEFQSHLIGTSWDQTGLSEYQTHHYDNSDNGIYQYGDLAASSRSEMHLHTPTPYQPPQQITPSSSTSSHIHQNNMNNNNNDNNIYGNMTRNALMQISAVPKPKLTNDWIQYRKSEPLKPSLNSHWLIQEAEQRRIEQMNNERSNTNNFKKKPLPDAVIHTIQQRIVDLGIGSNVNKR